jgi:PAS domain S-box-containing protein
MNSKPLSQFDDIRTLHEAFQKLTEGVEAYSMILLDPEGTILTWNKGVEKLKGYTAKEIIGQHIRMFYTPLDREKKLPEKLLQEARIKGIARHIGRRVRKNGTMFWGSIEITAIKDSKDRVIGFTKLARELKEAYDIGNFWFDNDGILYLRANPVPHTPENLREFRDLLLQASGGKRVCCIADVREAIFTEEGMSFSAETIPQIYRAVAFLTNNKEADENARNLMSLTPKDIPAEVFTDGQEAKKWIRQFCK